MKTLYLHIGTPKTGTSYIQHSLRINSKKIKKQGYRFPDLGLRFTNVGIARNGHFLLLREGVGKAKKIKDLKGLYDKIIKKIEKISLKYDNIILSEEGCWNNDYNIPKFVEDMKKRDIQVRIVVYLRRQDLFLQSHWAQKIKEGKISQKFEKYVKTNKEHLDYYNQCCKLRDIVGDGNLIIRIYEKQRFNKDTDILEDFYSAVGLILDNISQIPNNKKINESLTGIYVEVKRIINKFLPNLKNNGRIVKDLLKIQEKDTKKLDFLNNSYFGFEERLKFLKKYEEGNVNIAKEFLGQEDGILFREEIEDIDIRT